MYRAAASFNLWAIKAAEKRVERKNTLRHYSHNGHTNGHKHPSRQSTTDSSTTADHGMVTEADHEAANEDPVPEQDNYDAESDSSSNDSSASEDLGFDGPSSKGYKRSVKADVVSVSGVEPPFVNCIIRERVSPKGRIRPMEPESEIEALHMPTDHVGVISQRGPAKKWLAKRAAWDEKYRKDLMALRQNKIEDRMLAEKEGFLTRDLHGENPPLTAMVGW